MLFLLHTSYKTNLSIFTHNGNVNRAMQRLMGGAAERWRRTLSWHWRQDPPHWFSYLIGRHSLWDNSICGFESGWPQPSGAFVMGGELNCMCTWPPLGWVHTTSDWKWKWRGKAAFSPDLVWTQPKGACTGSLFLLLWRWLTKSS